MSFIELHQGCPITYNASQGMCWGPRGPFYTIFGTELNFLLPHFVLALFLGFVILSTLFILRKKEKIQLSNFMLAIIPIVSVIILFLLFALIAPVYVFY